MSRIIPTWAGLPDKPTIDNIAGALPLDKLPAHTHSWNDLPGLLPADKLPLHNHDSSYYTKPQVDAAIGGIDLSSRVPYTGATGPVNLGVHGLTAGSVKVESVSNSTVGVTIGHTTQGWIPTGPVKNAMASHQGHWSLAYHGVAGATNAPMTVGGHLGFAAASSATGAIDTRLARTAAGTLSVLASTSTADSTTLGTLNLKDLNVSATGGKIVFEDQASINLYRNASHLRTDTVFTANGFNSLNGVAAGGVGSIFGTSSAFDATMSLGVRPNQTTRIPLGVRLLSGQTADAFQVQDSAGAILLSIGPTGRLSSANHTINSTSTANGLTINQAFNGNGIVANLSASGTGYLFSSTSAQATGFSGTVNSTETWASATPRQVVGGFMTSGIDVPFISGGDFTATQTKPTAGTYGNLAIGVRGVGAATVAGKGIGVCGEAGSANSIAAVFKGFAGQTGSLTEWWDSANSAVAKMSASGVLVSKLQSSTVAPNTTDIGSGSCVWWHDTVGNSRRFAYNDGGSLHLSPLLKASIPAAPTDLAGVISVLQHWGLCA